MVTRIVDFPTVGIKVLVIGPKTPEWVSDILKYLNTNELPSDKGEARNVRNRATSFMVIDEVLYEKGSLNHF